VKKTLLATTLLTAGIMAAAQAAEVRFGGLGSAGWNNEPNWLTPAKTDEPDGSTTYSLTQDGVTFDLNIRGVTNFASIGSAVDVGIFPFANGAGMGINGGTSVSANGRISNNTAGNTGDDEYFIFTLSTSGLDLTSLSMTSLNIRYNTASRNMRFVDQNDISYSVQGHADDYSYFDLTGLTPLSLANVESWTLAVGMIDNNIAAPNIVSALGNIIFNYEVESSIVTNYSGQLWLGTGETAGESYTNSPAAWDSGSALWGLGPVASQSLWTNWIDGSDALINGTTNARFVTLATNLNVVVDELEWSGDAALWLTGVSNSSETITVTNQLITALAKQSRWIYINNANLGGSFELKNVGRLNFQDQAGVEPGTQITIADNSAVAFNGTTSDFTELSVSANGSQVYNQSVSDKTLGSLSGNGELRLQAGSTLTINGITVGGVSNVATITAHADSEGNLQMGSGTHNFSLNPATAYGDHLAIGSGTNFFGGDLVVIAVNTNTLSIGDAFQLFDAGTYAGSFNSIVLPTNNLPDGAEWNIDDLTVDGTISVANPGYNYKIFNFTDFFGVSTWAQTNAPYTEGSITNAQGTILTLRISMVEHDNVSVAFNYQMWPYNTSFGGLRRTTADGGNNNARLDAFETDGTTNRANDEIIQLELFVSGTPVDALAMKDLQLSSFGLDKVAEFNDGINTNTLVDSGGSDVVSYDDVLSGLTPLSLANVGSWTLQVASRDNGTTAINAFSFDNFRFSIGYQTQSLYELWSEAYELVEGADGDDDDDGMSNLYDRPTRPSGGILYTALRMTAQTSSTSMPAVPRPTAESAMPSQPATTLYSTAAGPATIPSSWGSDLTRAASKP
jgi:hypothetical protein